MVMERDKSWVRKYYYGTTSADHGELDSFSEASDEASKSAVSIDSALPDDMLERILANLPVASIFRAGCVCKRWKEIVTSKSFLWNCSQVLARKPWYFMFTSYDDPVGYAYDPALRKWYGIDLPDFVTSNWFTASSFGLVCFMNNDDRSEIRVCNPITRSYQRIVEPPAVKFSDYSSQAFSVDRVSHGYSIAIVKSKQVLEDYLQWDVSVVVYDSESMMWVTLLAEVLTGWRGGNESVICDGVLYFLIYLTGASSPDSRHGLIRLDLSNRSSHGLLMENFIPIPCALTCGRLMNLKERLVLVGGIGKQDRMDIIKGIGIWVLHGREWEEVARMPHKFFQGFGEFDDVFASSGMDDLVYIQSYGAPALLVFDMNLKQWRWSQKCPVTKKFPLQLFTGFCFEPRLEIMP